jgi:hypothetical protein
MDLKNDKIRSMGTASENGRSAWDALYDTTL